MSFMENKELIQKTLDFGAFKANVIETKDIVLDRAFRAMCESNACGVYGKCYMCPPDVGDIDELIAQVANYDHALVRKRCRRQHPRYSVASARRP